MVNKILIAFGSLIILGLVVFVSYVVMFMYIMINNKPAIEYGGGTIGA